MHNHKWHYLDGVIALHIYFVKFGERRRRGHQSASLIHNIQWLSSYHEAADTFQIKQSQR